MLKETIIVSVIVFGILTISWFYFSWKIEKEEKEKLQEQSDEKIEPQEKSKEEPPEGI